MPVSQSQLDLPAYPPNDLSNLKKMVEFVSSAPMRFGPWREWKRLYKQAEGDSTVAPELMGALLRRLDTMVLSANTSKREFVQTSNLQYPQLLKIRNGVGYVSSTRMSVLLDLNSPDIFKPRKIASFSHPFANRAQFCGPYLILVEEGNDWKEGKLYVYENNDTKNPTRRGSVPVRIIGDFVCAYPFVYAITRLQNRRNSGFAGLLVLSIADPDAPQVIAQLAVPNPAGLDISSDGRTVLVAAGGSGFQWNRLPQPPGLHLIDVSDPLHPREIAHRPVPNLLAGEVHGNHLFLLTGSGNSLPTLHTWDISQPERAFQLGQVGLRQLAPNVQVYNVSQFYVRNNIGFLPTGTGQTLLIDVAKPEAPRLAGTLKHEVTRGVEVHNSILYTLAPYTGLEAWNISDPAQPIRVGTPPSPDTIGYMKRRGRRYLKNLGKTNPDRFTEIAYQVLTASTRDPELDSVKQWITFDLLYGGSGHWQQSAHGRGGYRKISQGPRFHRRRRHERFSSAWDAHLDRVQAILERPDLAIAVYAFAVRVLLANRRPLPTVPLPIAARWADGTDTLLTVLGARVLAEAAEAARSLPPEGTASAYIAANPGNRKRIQERLATITDPDWLSRFATQLTQLLARQAQGNRLTRRAVASAALLAARFPTQIKGTALLELAPLLLRSRQAELESLVRSAARQATLDDLEDWLQILGPLTEIEQEPAVVGLEEAFRKVAIPAQTISRLTTGIYSRSVYDVIWRIIAASQSDSEHIKQAWLALLERTKASDALLGAMASPHALALLTRCGITNQQISEFIQTRPFLSGLLSEETFARMVQGAAIDSVLSLVVFMDEATWQRLRGIWLRELQKGRVRTGFWIALEAGIKTDRSGNLNRRLLEDTDFFATLPIPDIADGEELLAMRTPEMDRVIARFLSHHQDALPANAPLLLQAATHILPLTRSIGLRRVSAVGMNLSFALRLLESELPESVALGQSYFVAVPEDRLEEYGLALCDSPVQTVRRFGRAFVTKFGLIRQSAILAHLFENPDPETQRFVAEELNAVPKEERPDSTQFDRDVLRRRNASRRAREAVKTRLSYDPTVDIATLLSLARGQGTPRDAEWALSQLAKRALAGEQIPGFTLEGVAV